MNSVVGQLLLAYAALLGAAAAKLTCIYHEWFSPRLSTFEILEYIPPKLAL